MIIGIVGKAGSGKDTVAHMIPGAKLLSFADPLKEFCAQVFEWNRNTLWGPSENRNRPDPRYGGLTPRHALQTLGTQWGRACYENVWVDLGIRRAKEWLETQVDIVGGDYAVRVQRPAVAVFTDCRFINEAKAIRATGGQVWEVVRPGAGLAGAAGAHASELEQDSPEMKALVTTTILNDASFPQLRGRVLDALAT